VCPPPYARLQSCPHITETIFQLEVSEARLTYPSFILSATGPENPYDWDKSLHVRWRALDTLEVGYTDALHIESREDSAAAVRVVYLAEHAEHPWWRW
jgi:hypothetical protein